MEYKLEPHMHSRKAPITSWGIFHARGKSRNTHATASTRNGYAGMYRSGAPGSNNSTANNSVGTAPVTNASNAHRALADRTNSQPRHSRKTWNNAIFHKLAWTRPATVTGAKGSLSRNRLYKTPSFPR